MDPGMTQYLEFRERGRKQFDRGDFARARLALSKAVELQKALPEERQDQAQTRFWFWMAALEECNQTGPNPSLLKAIRETFDSEEQLRWVNFNAHHKKFYWILYLYLSWRDYKTPTMDHKTFARTIFEQYAALTNEFAPDWNSNKSPTMATRARRMARALCAVFTKPDVSNQIDKRITELANVRQTDYTSAQVQSWVHEMHQWVRCIAKLWLSNDTTIVEDYAAAEILPEETQGGHEVRCDALQRVFDHLRREVNETQLEKLVPHRAKHRHKKAVPLSTAKQPPSSSLVQGMLEQFVTCVRHLSSRKQGRPAFVIESEYDVQDLVYVMLKPTFTDLEFEEWTPKSGGSTKRVDLSSRLSGFVLEIKFVNSDRDAKEVFEEIRQDIEGYYEHPACKSLYFFVWDPLNLVQDKPGKERDLSGDRRIKDSSFEVKIMIRPS